MVKSKDSLEDCARQLEESDEYRVLRRIHPRSIVKRAIKPSEKTVIILDTETTGLDLTKDQAIEIGILAVVYSDDGSVGDVIDAYSALNEPRLPIRPEISELTGITQTMLRGKRFDIGTIEELIKPAALIVAHNAAFDRPICEKITPTFANKPWACSATEIEWKSLGFEGVKLGYLTNQSGRFHTGHRALDDCHALLEILTKELPKGDSTAFQHLLRSARQIRYRVSLKAPYQQKDVLRSRGYRWNAATRSWWIELNEEQLKMERGAIEKQLSIKTDDTNIERMTAFNRFKQ